MKPRKILLSALMLSFSAMQGCSVMSKDECLSADWESRGLNDGAAGKG